MASLTKACVLAAACLVLESAAAMQTCSKGATNGTNGTTPLKDMMEKCKNRGSRNETWNAAADCAGASCDAAKDWQCCTTCPFLVIDVPKKVLTAGTFGNVSITMENVTTALQGLSAQITVLLNASGVSDAVVKKWMAPVGDKVAAQVCAIKIGNEVQSLTKFNTVKGHIKTALVAAASGLCQAVQACVTEVGKVKVEFADEPPTASGKQTSSATAAAIPGLAFLVVAFLASASH